MAKSVSFKLDVWFFMAIAKPGFSNERFFQKLQLIAKIRKPGTIEKKSVRA